MEGRSRPRDAGGPAWGVAAALMVLLAAATAAGQAPERREVRSPGGVRTGIFGLETRGKSIEQIDRELATA